ncbi:MAG: GumC family protein, partial [Hyphomicrobiales bacterium]|nr:GumC family protein [Hyphomicrobiales bacterium]
MSGTSYTDAKEVDVDFGSLLGVIWQAKSRIILFTLIVVGIAFIWANTVKPRYASEARILIESGETSFTRPKDAQPVDDSKSMLDEQAVASQVQVISSRDLARLVVRKLDLGKLPEFDSALDGISIFKQIFVVVGLVRDPLQMSAEERVLEKYYDRLTVYQIGKSRVIAIEFEASTPELAAKVANAIADEYVSWQQNAKRENTKDAAAWLESEIADLRKKVADAEARVAEFRSGSDLLVGQNNTSLNAQQLSDLNTELAR